MRSLLTLLTVITSLVLSGCGLVYKMEINQGNYVTQDMASRLKEGQTRQQVRLALGSPVTESIFHPNRWDYDYSLERRGKAITSHRLTVYFEDDKVKRWDVAKLPDSPLVDRDPAYYQIEKDNQSGNDGPGWWSGFMDWWRK